MNARLIVLISHTPFSKDYRHFYPVGEPISPHLLRCEAFAVEDHSFTLHALRLQQPWLVKYPGEYPAHRRSGKPCREFLFLYPYHFEMSMICGCNRPFWFLCRRLTQTDTDGFTAGAESAKAMSLLGETAERAI